MGGRGGPGLCHVASALCACARAERRQVTAVKQHHHRDCSGVADSSRARSAGAGVPTGAPGQHERIGRRRQQLPLVGAHALWSQHAPGAQRGRHPQQRGVVAAAIPDELRDKARAVAMRRDERAHMGLVPALHVQEGGATRRAQPLRVGQGSSRDCRVGGRVRARGGTGHRGSFKGFDSVCGRLGDSSGAGMPEPPVRKAPAPGSPCGSLLRNSRPPAVAGPGAACPAHEHRQPAPQRLCKAPARGGGGELCSGRRRSAQAASRQSTPLREKGWQTTGGASLWPTTLTTSPTCCGRAPPAGLWAARLRCCW